MSTELPIERIAAAVARAVEGVRGIAAVYLYGSKLVGRVSRLSDIDLALVLAGDSEDPLFAKRVAALVSEELGGDVEIDGHVAADLPLPVRGRVVTQSRLIYERDPSLHVEFETATRRLYFDFLPLLERDAREGLRAGG